MSGISQAMNDVRSRARQGLVGMWAMLSSLNREGFGINQDPQAAQVTTVTLTDPGDSKNIIVTINGVDVEIATGTGGTDATLGAALALAINAEPLVRGQVEASFDTVTLTLTGLTPGEAFTVSIANDPDSALSAVSTTTAATDADPIPFGVAVMTQGYRTDEGEQKVCRVLDDKFSYQVVTATIAFVDTAKLRARVYEVRGDERILLADVTETSATSRDATIDALVTGLEAALPANTVSAAADNATATAIVFTAEVKGFEFLVEVSAGDEGASVPAITVANTTGPSISTSLHRALAGISLYSSVDPAATIGGTAGQYAANAGIRIGQVGELWASNSQSPSFGDTVYVEMDDSAGLNGYLYNSSSSTRVALSRARAKWERAGLTSTDALAAVRLSL